MLFEIAKKKILFIHIPKCGGTSVEVLLNRLSTSPINLNNNECHPELLWGQLAGKQLQHLTFNEVREYIDIDDVDFCFAITRDPQSRIISEINWQFSHPYFQYSCSIEKILEGFFSEKKDKFCHYMLQHEFICSDKRLNIYDLKELDILERDISKIIGKEIKIPKNLNASKKIFSLEDFSTNIRSKIDAIVKLEKQGLHSLGGASGTI